MEIFKKPVTVERVKAAYKAAGVKVTREGDFYDAKNHCACALGAIALAEADQLKRSIFIGMASSDASMDKYADFFGWRNMVSPWGGAAVGTAGHMFLFKLHGFWLDQKAGRWSNAGGGTLGHDPTGQSGSHVGTEFDIGNMVRELDRIYLELLSSEPLPCEVGADADGRT